MNEIQKAAERKPIEWKNQVVITTALLAEVYETDVDNVKKNFNRHKDNFIDGTHYFLLQGKDLKEFKNRVTDSPLVGKNANQLYLWTERGANRHCKILDTDKAWEQFDNLEETYFNKKQEVINRSQLSQSTQALFGLIESMAKQELEQKRQAEQLNRIEQKQEVISDTFTHTLTDEDFKAWVNRCIAKIAESPHYTNGSSRQGRYQNVRTESYDRLRKKWNCNLNDRVARAKGRALDNKPNITKKELEAINKLSIIAEDKSLKPIYETVIKEMMICYCAKN